MICETAKTSALNAAKMSKMLNKQWDEEPDAYYIQTNIKSHKDNQKINDLCFNRYIL